MPCIHPAANPAARYHQVAQQHTHNRTALAQRLSGATSALSTQHDSASPLSRASSASGCVMQWLKKGCAGMVALLKQVFSGVSSTPEQNKIAAILLRADCRVQAFRAPAKEQAPVSPAPEQVLKISDPLAMPTPALSAAAQAKLIRRAPEVPTNDASERKRLEAELASVAKMKATLVADVSDRLNAQAKNVDSVRLPHSLKNLERLSPVYDGSLT